MNRIASIALVIFPLIGCLPICGQQPATSQTQPKTPAQSQIQIDNTRLPQIDASQKPESKPQSQVFEVRTDNAVLTSKDYVKAADTYQIELQKAEQLGDTKAEAAFALKRARALDTLSAADQTLVPEATASYFKAMRAADAMGDSVQRSLAANNLTVLLLKQGKVTEAGVAARAIDISSVPHSQRPVFQFNIGRALELNGNTWEAYQMYSQALSVNPGLMPAWEGAFRTLSKQQTPSFSELVRLSDAATASGHPEIASGQLVNSLMSYDDAKFNNAMSALTPQRLLNPLLRSYRAQELSPVLFRSRELPLLQKIAESHNSMRTAIRDIERAYLEKLPPGFDESATAFSNWRSGYDDSRALQGVLEGVADFYVYQGEPEMALGRYGAAWAIAHEPRCAIQYASVVSRNPSLDPSGTLVGRLVQDIFMQKGQAYLAGNWTHILPLHIALGTIFEAQKKWGDPYDPRGALFQWQHAVSADAEVRKKNPAFPPSPGIHTHLGNVYKALGRRDDAIKEFLIAGSGFLEAGDREEAHKNAAAIQQISPGGLSERFSAEDRSRWELLMRGGG